MAPPKHQPPPQQQQHAAPAPAPASDPASPPLQPSGAPTQQAAAPPPANFGRHSTGTASPPPGKAAASPIAAPPATSAPGNVVAGSTPLPALPALPALPGSPPTQAKPSDGSATSQVSRSGGSLPHQQVQPQPQQQQQPQASGGVGASLLAALAAAAGAGGPGPSGAGGGGGGGGGNTSDSTHNVSTGSSARRRYGTRSSDSGGGVIISSFLASPPAPKGSSISGAPSASVPHSASQSQQSQSAGSIGAHGGLGRGRLQQLGQRLNFVGLGRKKHATFAPGVSGGGNGGGGGTLSGNEDNGGSGGNGGGGNGGGGGGATAAAAGGGGATGSTLGVTSTGGGGGGSLIGHLHNYGGGGSGREGGSVTAAAPSMQSASGTGFSLGGALGSARGEGGSNPPPPGSAAAGTAAGGSSKLPVEEFNPPNHPVNPFSYLATPFRVMAKTKAGVAMGRYATTALRLKRDGVPPASYMWLWLGNFKRWHRRYFVASEAPGVLLIYKRANMKGKVWSISLCDAAVVQDESHPRQIRLVSPAGTIFLRVLRPEERQPWIACLRESVATYRKHKEVVDTFTAAAAAAAAAGEGGEAGGPAALPLSSGAVDQDMEQRRRIRTRLNDRLAELGPLVTEVERHLGLLGTLLAGAASGVGQLSAPLLSNSMSVSHGLNTRGARGQSPYLIPTTPAATPAAAESAGGAAAGAANSAGSSPLAPAAHAAAADAAAATAAEAAAIAAAAASSRGGGGGAVGGSGGGGGGAAWAPESSPGSVRLSGGRAGVTASGEAEPAPLEKPGPRIRSRSRALTGTVGVQAPHLAAAVSALVDAVRATLHNDAVRITTLEAENAALNKTLNILRASTHRSVARGRGMSASTPGHNAAAAAAAAGIMGGAGSTSRSGGVAGLAAGGSGGGGPAAASPAGAGAAGAGLGAEDAASEGSACTADEDAFDVVEAFDDGVDYSILDDDAPHLHHRLGVDDEEGPYVQHGNYPGGADEEEESDEDAEEDAAELAQQAEVLNALEVVRQVEYIAANDKDAQLKTLLTADTPPPPDVDEEEGGKGKRKSRKGEDTDATLDDDDDEDSDEAPISTGGAAGGGGSGGGSRSGLGRRPYEGRSRLPAPKPLGRGFSIWSILKNMIGRDLTKITMPATINEPMSMTQRLAEVLEYRCLLDRACVTPLSVDRLMLVGCWLLSGYNSQPQRDNKPFNPLLGETFEWQAADGSSRYIGEQVSHHPPVSCFLAEGGGPQGYELYGEVETKTKFWGKTLDCILAGHMTLRLKAFGEEYRCNLGNLVINDIILGRFWVDLSCDLKIRNLTTGDSARMLIKPCRGYPYLKERGKCDGVVYDAEGREVWRISGSSMSAIHAALTPDAAAARGEGATTEPQLVWTREPELPNPTEQYCMTRFALGLNDPADPIVPHLPPTDARFRPDVRALELGEWNRATSEKLRLEEKQRTVRRLRKEAGQEYHPRWFRQVLPNAKEMAQPASQPGSVWEYTHEYWDARAKKEWGDLPDLY